VTFATVYRAIGTVECAITEALRPEVIRAVESQLVLEPEFAPAVAALEVGEYLWVAFHLHKAEAWHSAHMEQLFKRRIACRPNPIGVTLTRIVAAEGSTITVIGLDAIDGSPILDIKPYKPIFDTPPVHPARRTL
jgi:tRNA (Thr-GGU) A37 N-methylase